jgi:hypothetical protein
MQQAGGLHIDLYDMMYYCITIVRSIAGTGLDRSLNEALIGERNWEADTTALAAKQNSKADKAANKDRK